MEEQGLAIVTGACGGMGSAQARLLVEQRWHVMVVDHRIEAAETLAGELGASATPFYLDVKNESDWAALVDEVDRWHGRIDLLVNNAAYYVPRPMMQTTVHDFEQHVDVNQKGVFLGMQAVTPAMKRNGHGSIVNIASSAGLRGLPGRFAYVATKWAVRGMSLAAAVELAPDGIRVNAIFPGTFVTPMSLANSLSTPQGRAGAIADVPAGRLGEPREVADVVAYLASNRSSYVTGTEFRMDGAKNL